MTKVTVNQSLETKVFICMIVNLVKCPFAWLYLYADLNDILATTLSHIRVQNKARKVHGQMAKYFAKY